MSLADLWRYLSFPLGLLLGWVLVRLGQWLKRYMTRPTIHELSAPELLLLLEAGAERRRREGQGDRRTPTLQGVPGAPGVDPPPTDGQVAPR